MTDFKVFFADFNKIPKLSLAHAQAIGQARRTNYFAHQPGDEPDSTNQALAQLNAAPRIAASAVGITQRGYAEQTIYSTFTNFGEFISTSCLVRVAGQPTTNGAGNIVWPRGITLAATAISTNFKELNELPHCICTLIYDHFKNRSKNTIQLLREHPKLTSHMAFNFALLETGARSLQQSPRGPVQHIINTSGGDGLQARLYFKDPSTSYFKDRYVYPYQNITDGGQCISTDATPLTSPGEVAALTNPFKIFYNAVEPAQLSGGQVKAVVVPADPSPFATAASNLAHLLLACGRAAAN